ncbi:hypothetical protein OQA88_9086 [Cercophora sp. LCS_1]
MRLLHVRTYKLYTFVRNPPPYAILSHTWGTEEVTFDDISRETRSALRGWSKVEKCCERAISDGLEYVWIDTCCIDKTDSSELSEAINSMYRYYEEADVCYAFLHNTPKNVRMAFEKSPWFTRGWTLQELLAPMYLLFVDWEWEPIGTREQLLKEISKATGIEERHILNPTACSVATKLSWAANRETTRIEDRTYSLLGLLGINMPLIYGEGDRAFERLQQELIRQQADESILLWGRRWLGNDAGKLEMGHTPITLFATSPSAFEKSNGLVPWSFINERGGFTVTNAGLSISRELFEVTTHLDLFPVHEPVYALKLNCSWSLESGEPLRNPMVMLLTNNPSGSDFFQRCDLTLRSWSEMSLVTKHWKSLGRRDIVITPPSSGEPRFTRTAGRFQSMAVVKTILDSPNIFIDRTCLFFSQPVHGDSGGESRWTVENRALPETPDQLSTQRHGLMLDYNTALLPLFTAIAIIINVMPEDGSSQPEATFCVLVKLLGGVLPKLGIFHFENGVPSDKLVRRLAWDHYRDYPTTSSLGLGRFMRANLAPGPPIRGGSAAIGILKDRLRGATRGMMEGIEDWDLHYASTAELKIKVETKDLDE